jgi:hypothetical protein
LVNIRSGICGSIESHEEISTELGLICDETLLNLVFIVKVDALGRFFIQLNQTIFGWVSKAKIFVSHCIVKLIKLSFGLLQAELGCYLNTIPFQTDVLVISILEFFSVWE